MREQPQGADLLDAARDLLLAELLPKLPEAQRFAARMVANAMAIAAREARDNGGWIAAAEARITALTGSDAAHFTTMIRAGAFDPGRPGHAEAAATLLAITRARCAVSAPRALG